MFMFSQGTARSVCGQVSLLPIFLFALVSQCVGQEHDPSGLDFTIGF
jgi:hypothetical protein